MIGLKSILRFSSKKWCEGYVTVFLILHTDNTREVSTETFYNFIKNWKIKTIIFLHLPLKLFLPVLVDNVLMLGTEAALLLLLMKLLLILDIRDLGGGGGGGGISGFRLTSVWNKFDTFDICINHLPPVSPVLISGLVFPSPSPSAHTWDQSHQTPAWRSVRETSPAETGGNTSEPETKQI